MGSAWRWTRKAWELVKAHPLHALRCAGALMLPSLLWTILFLLLNHFGPQPEVTGLAGTGLDMLVGMGLAALQMPFIGAAYATTYGFALSGRASWEDFLFGLKKPLGMVLTFFSVVFLSIVGLGFLGGGSVVWAMPVMAVGGRRFPAPVQYSVARTTRNLTTLLHAMGVMAWLMALVLAGLGLALGCLWLVENAGDFGGVLLVGLSPAIAVGWLMFPFAMLVHCVGARDELGLQEGPFTGRLKGHEEKKAALRPTAVGVKAPVRPLRASQESACAVCGEPAPTQARYCPHCRSPLQGT